jgi:hypothetical protein
MDNYRNIFSKTLALLADKQEMACFAALISLRRA